MANERARCGLSVVTMLNALNEAKEKQMGSPTDTAQVLERVRGATEACRLDADVGSITFALSGANSTPDQLEEVKSNFVEALVDEGLPEM